MLKRSFLLLLIAGLVLAGCNVDPVGSAPQATPTSGQGTLESRLSGCRAGRLDFDSSAQRSDDVGRWGPLH